MNQPYNLDTDVSEYFEFIIKGNTYQFRYPTTRELEEFNGIDEKSEDKTKEFLAKFISKVDEKSPDVVDLLNSVNIKYWVRFSNMVKTELTTNGN
ncbi:MAG: hypothetical protein LC096_05415 [Bacteroidia bacterium]|nr:hypothetical protein [Bacteroidia bacterium]